MLNKGYQVALSKNCFYCHSLDGATKSGPSFLELKKKQRTVFENGIEKQITIDENYLRSSIVMPSKQVVKGFKNLMPELGNRLNKEEIDLLIYYLNSIK